MKRAPRGKIKNNNNKKKHLEAKLHENMRRYRLVTDYGFFKNYSTSRYMVKIVGTKYFILFGRLNDM